MKAAQFAVMLALFPLTGCASKGPDEATTKAWAVSIAKNPDKAPKECERAPNPPIPSNGSKGGSSASEYRKLQDYSFDVLKRHDVCGGWARGQRQ